MAVVIIAKMVGYADPTLEKRKMRMLAWAEKLPAVAFNKDQDYKFQTIVQGTGLWFLKDVEKWNSSESGSGILGVYGQAGCGKSHLAALTINWLNSGPKIDSDGVGVAYIYCSSIESESTVEPEKLMSSILKQLCHQISTSNLEPLERIFDKYLSHSDLGQLREAFTLVISRFQTVFIVVDGLDECSKLGQTKFKMFCDFIRSLIRNTTEVVKIIIFSRPGHAEVENAFGSFSRIIIDADRNRDDIRQFISHVLSSNELHIGKDARLLEEIREVLLKNADGMFLWVSLFVQDLKSLRTRDEVEDLMQNLPTDLNDAYARALGRILNQRPAVSRRALKILLWVANAKTPLSRGELYEALAIKAAAKDLKPGNVISKDADNGLTAECADLIILRDDHYYLLHASLLEYLRRLSGEDSQHLGEFAVMQAHAEKSLAEACLTYLQFERFQEGPLSNVRDLLEFRQRNPFYAYASIYWEIILAQISRQTCHNWSTISCHLLHI